MTIRYPMYYMERNIYFG